MIKKLFLGILISLALISSLIGPLKGDIFFHTDIARDFLLIQDIVINKNLTLIGPRAGGIPGVFHGPFWLYLNAIPFYLANGNPLFISWFWYILMIFGLFISFSISKKIFNLNIALISTAFLSIFYIRQVNNFFNPYGALLISPLFFYFIYQKKYIFAFLVLGIIFQFQMAFAVPLLLLSIPLVYKKLYSLIGLLPGLSTFIFFEIRHQFIQSKALLSFIEKGLGDNSNLYYNRINSFLNSSNVFISSDIYFKIFSLILFIFSLCILYKKKPYFTKIFIYYYFGYWLITFVFGGNIQSYYYIQFIPIIFYIFSHLPSFIIIPILIFNLYSSHLQNLNYKENIIGKNILSWQFYKNTISEVLKKEKNTFSYFVYSQDQYGYATKYTLSYLSNKNIIPYQKSKITYLFKEPDIGENPYTSYQDWKLNKVKINKKPVEVLEFKNGYRIEKYILDETEISLKSDDNLIKDLIFR